MPTNAILPQLWVSAANMATRRGEAITIRAVNVRAYIVQLQDGSALAYTDGADARAFRTADQARATLDAFKIPDIRINIADA